MSRKVFHLNYIVINENFNFLFYRLVFFLPPPKKEEEEEEEEEVIY